MNHHLQQFWTNTAEHRIKVQEVLNRLGVTGIDCTPCWSDLQTLETPHMAVGDESAIATAHLCNMLDVKSTDYNGFYLLNLFKAMDTEESLIQRLQNAIGDIPIKQMAAFKTNHSAILQFMRLRANPDAGIDVAGTREAISACSIGFKPENIIYSNPNFSQRELIICTALGIANFCFDHPAKLAMVEQLPTYGVDVRSVNMILRLNTPYSAATLNFDRFGIDVEKNRVLIQTMLNALGKNISCLAGVSFHIGVGVRSLVAYENAFDFAATVLKLLPNSEQALRRIVNIGGSFAFHEYGHQYQGTISTIDQMACIGRCARQLNSELSAGIELWSEIGQGYVGGAGSVFTRVDIHEKRENPNQYLDVSPLTIPGAFIWGHPAKKIFARSEQWLTGCAGRWSFPVQHLATLYPEVWGITEDGVGGAKAERITAPEKNLIPTLIFGKTCDPSDVLNPLVGREYVRFLLPDLSQFTYSQYALRFCSAAYMDFASGFNGQTVQDFPWHFVVNENASIATQNVAAVSEEQWEYRDRLLSHGILTASQVQQTKEMVANQFIEREQIISWLISTRQIASAEEIASLRYLIWEKVSATVDNGLSMMRLKVQQHRPDAEGTVVAAVTAMALDHSMNQELPLAIARDRERRISRLAFEIEARVLRRLTRINGGLREKIFPSCYIAMSAKIPGEGGSTLELRQRVHDLAQGAGFKSVSNVATGEFTTRLSQKHPDVTRVIAVPYQDISFYDRKPFDGIHFGNEPGQISCFVRDFRGPSRFEETLPNNQLMPIRIDDRGFKDPNLAIF